MSTNELRCGHCGEVIALDADPLLHRCRKGAGFLLVGTTGHGEVTINHRQMEVDENGIGHIVFSPAEAMELAKILRRKALEARTEGR